LGVSRLSEFTGTLQDAEERLKRYIEEQTGIEAEQQAFDFAKAREIEF
jgi:hypothetical protein